MRLSTSIRLVAFLWLVGEILAFALAVKVIGVAGTILVGLATSLIGLFLLKRTGSAAKLKLRAILSGRGNTPPDGLVDEALAAFGAVALLLPGFLSDIVGLTLALPVMRDRAGGWLRKGVLRMRGKADGSSAGQQSAIDLEPGQWRRTEAPVRPLERPGV